MPRKRKEVEEEEEGVTRCVCGLQELPSYASKQRGVDPSLFIQCEQCEVWQHGFCLGLRARDVPDVYFCDECRPEFHELRQRNGHTVSKYVPTTRQSSPSEGHEDEPSPQERRKRRQTMNSREDDILQRVLEESAREAELLRQGKDPKAKEEDESEDDAQEEQDQEECQQDQEQEAENAKQEDEEPEQVNQEPEEDDNDNDQDQEQKPEIDQDAADAEQEEQGSIDNEEPAEEHEEPEEKAETLPPPPKRKRRAPGRPGSRAAKGTGVANGRKFKPKIPSPRITIPEMRKRVAMILDFSGHTQTEMDTEEKLRFSMLEDHRQRTEPSPVIAQLESLYTQHKQNITQLEGLTAKLLAWQEKYG